MLARTDREEDLLRFETLLRQAGRALPQPPRPWRHRVLVAVARRSGVRRVLPTVVRAEAADRDRYRRIERAASGMASEEAEHGRTLALASAGLGCGRGHGRPLGVILLAGITGLTAGAGSMAAGEWVSVRHLATSVMADPDIALETLAREELGLNPSDLGSPWTAAISSLHRVRLGSPGSPYPVPVGHRCGGSAGLGGPIGGGAALTTYLIGSLVGVTLD